MLEHDKRKLPIYAIGIDFEPFCDLRCTNTDLLAKKSLQGHKLCPDNNTIISFYKCNGVVIWYNRKRPKRLITKICDSNFTIGKYIAKCFGNPPLSALCLDRFHFIALEKKDTYYNVEDIDYKELQAVLYRIINSVANFYMYQKKYEYIQYMEQRLPPWLQ